jgi:hypothetical protein
MPNNRSHDEPFCKYFLIETQQVYPACHEQFTSVVTTHNPDFKLFPAKGIFQSLKHRMQQDAADICPSFTPMP